MRVLVETKDLVTPGAREEVEAMAEARRKEHNKRFKGMGGKPNVAPGGSPNALRPADPGLTVGITVDRPRKTPREEYREGEPRKGIVDNPRRTGGPLVVPAK